MLLRHFIFLILFAGVGCAAERGIGVNRGDGDGGQLSLDGSVDASTNNDAAIDSTSIDVRVNSPDDGGGSADTDPGPIVDARARVCSSGETTCADGVYRVCRADGRGFDVHECDATMDLRCEAGTCRGACSPSTLGSSYIGCDYYPTITANSVNSAFRFGVAVASAHSESSTITVTRGSTVVTTFVLAPREVRMIELDWIPELKGGDWGADTIPVTVSSAQIADAAYRVRSTRPVSAYQFNAVKYTLGDVFPPTCPGRVPPAGGAPECFSFSNDASLLFPANALGADYTVAGWHSQHGQTFLAVTATQDNTVVSLNSPAGVDIVPTGEINASGDGTVMMNAGDVLQVVGTRAPLPDAGNPFGPRPNLIGADLTGATVSANAPVQVLAGNSCARVPYSGTETCDHIEESMVPRLALGTSYFATTFAPASTNATGGYTLRLVGLATDTEITFNPPIEQSGSTTSTLMLQPGVVREFVDVRQDLELSGDKVFLVAKYMQGWLANGLTQNEGAGDPSLVTLPPRRQFRSEYVFYTSNTYDTTWVTLIAPVGAIVTVDDIAVPQTAFTAIGSTGFAAARYRLGAAEGHTARSTQPFGIEVYGYGAFTSYAYPGGLDLVQRPI